MQVSYCILAGIGISSIGVFWLVQLHRTRERQRRLKHAKRTFALRWRSVTGSMGVSASAAVAAQRGLKQRAQRVPPQANATAPAADAKAAAAAPVLAVEQPSLPVSPFDQPGLAADPPAAVAAAAGARDVPANRQQQQGEDEQEARRLGSMADGPQTGGELAG